MPGQFAITSAPILIFSLSQLVSWRIMTNRELLQPFRPNNTAPLPY